MTENTDFKNLKSELEAAARWQDTYDLETLNLISPSNPTLLKYFPKT